MNDRARRVAAAVKVYRQLGIAKSPRRPVVRQLMPTGIERAYGKAIT